MIILGLEIQKITESGHSTLYWGVGNERPISRGPIKKNIGIVPNTLTIYQNMPLI